MLSAAERKELKARAHRLEPVVMIGTKGLTDEVVKEVDVALKAHELIKVRVRSADRSSRDAIFSELATRTGSALVQRIGHVGVLYKPAPVIVTHLGFHGAIGLRRVDFKVIPTC